MHHIQFFSSLYNPTGWHQMFIYIYKFYFRFANLFLERSTEIMFTGRFEITVRSLQQQSKLVVLTTARGKSR